MVEQGDVKFYRKYREISNLSHHSFLAMYINVYHVTKRICNNLISKCNSIEHFGIINEIIFFIFCALSKDWLRKILEIKTTKAIFHSYVLRTLLDKHNEWRLPGFMLCDPTAVAIALHETIVTKSRDVFATVELHGRLSRGQMISNNRHKPNVTLAQEIDTDIMMKLISDVFKEES